MQASRLGFEPADCRFLKNTLGTSLEVASVLALSKEPTGTAQLALLSVVPLQVNQVRYRSRPQCDKSGGSPASD